MRSFRGHAILSNRDCLVDLLRAMLRSRIQKTSGRDKTLSEVHSVTCELVRNLTQSPFYITTSFADQGVIVAAILSDARKVKDCICVNIDTSEVEAPISIEVRLCA